MRLLFLLTGCIAFVSVSDESPIEGSTLPPEPIADNHAHRHDVMHDGDSTNKYGDENAMKQDVNRFNYSRQLALTTTLGYDEWWFATTRRPQISLKDFPGKPGVATWKEIYPSAPADSRKSRKMGPTAEGVSSSCRNQIISYNFSLNLVTSILAILFLHFCRT